jgi:hypothetical protein
MSILLQISASDAAVESILRTAASTGPDAEAQMSFEGGDARYLAARWLESTIVLCRYATSVHADTRAEVTFPLTRCELLYQAGRPKATWFTRLRFRHRSPTVRIGG